MLWRALKHIEQGFYVDIGAQNPVVDSVSLAFYENGWRGVHIEPSPRYASLLREHRPDEVVIQAAIGIKHDEGLVFYEIPETGLSTAEESIARRHQAAGFSVRNIVVPCLTLDEALAPFFGREIHWLKIDVEGHEQQVLQGWKAESIKPWIVMIESTLPLTQTEFYDDWEQLIVGRGYQFAYFDGLNRFYLSPDHPELLGAFKCGPNVFDDFALSGEAHAPFCILLNEKIQQAEERAQRAEVQAHNLENQLAAVYASTSWWITRPLRVPGQAIAKILKWLLSFLKRIARRPVFYVLIYALNKSRHRNKIGQMIALFPALEAYLNAFLRNNKNLSQDRLLIRRSPSGKLAMNVVPADWKASQVSHAAPPKTSSRTIYYFVDHTILCPVNSGMQRVARRLGRALHEAGERIRFVKWDANHHKFALINREELTYLSRWQGPQLTEADWKQYPADKDVLIPIERHESEECHWMVVPEVTHITYQDHPVTLDVLMEAKRLGLKTAFVYYDATPLRRIELKEMAPNHEIYMQQLLLADLVVPISNWSARDLVSFLQVHEVAGLYSTPRISALTLAGESSLQAPRITVPDSFSGARKMILSVGTIATHKNQIALVHAFERYCSSYPETDWQLALVGDCQPDLEPEITRVATQNSRIRYLRQADDDDLVELYRGCAFSVFPSIEEGFGLPILESLWYAKPCICANFGSMAEVAEGGGCLTIDMRNSDELLGAITRLTKDAALLEQLSREAVTRNITSWNDYGRRFITQLNEASDPLKQMGTIYYWVNQTCSYPDNNDAQRVVRGLACALLELGLNLIPAKWDENNRQFYPPTPEDLQNLSKWNGPPPSRWSHWVDPAQALASDWILIPEVTTYLAKTNHADIKSYAVANKLRCAWIFHDAIPLKMRGFYPVHDTLAHQSYMNGLNVAERVFAISEQSRVDLRNFLAASAMPTPILDERILACALPGEFPEIARVTEIKRKTTGITKILCVCPIEPSKNHLGLLEAYARLMGQIRKPLELWLVGGSAFPGLTKQINHYINTIPGIHWEQSADDARLRELYAECDFTVYPSLEEGSGWRILESLWHARPCICRNSGAMAEVAEGGGCLVMETADATELTKAMLRLIDDDELRQQLAREAANRYFKSWREYAREVAISMATERPVLLPQKLPEMMGKADFYKQFLNLQPRPLLSICISTYNRAEWLALSLKNLTRLVPDPRAEIEIVVCDNTSTDHTPDVVQPYLGRTDFRYYRNPENVGMLGNLRVTANHAKGQYIWILGDDDLLKTGSVEYVIQVIRRYPGIALLYLNYALTCKQDAKEVADLDQLLHESPPNVPPGPDITAPVHQISTVTENFFTAIYCLVFRRDHALKAYSQNTDGRPFSTLLTCVPTTYYVLNFMMNEPACWVGEPQLVVNTYVSWLKYISIWTLERFPEIHDLAEKMGADPNGVNHWRTRHLPEVVHFFREIFENDQESNIEYFSAQRLVERMKHLDKFEEMVEMFWNIYDSAHNRGLPGASVPTSRVFAAFEKL